MEELDLVSEALRPVPDLRGRLAEQGYDQCRVHAQLAALAA
jgi:hypothetical protein